jgi:hypothetical protein
MNAMHSVVAVLLLIGVCCVMLLGMPGQAEAAPLISCPTFGCPGGPDNCMSASISIRGVVIAVTCYVKAVQMPV